MQNDIKFKWEVANPVMSQCLHAKPSAVLSFSGRASIGIKNSTKKIHQEHPRGTRQLPQTRQPQPLGHTVWGLSDAPSSAHHLAQTHNVSRGTGVNPPTSVEFLQVSGTVTES